MSIVWSVLGTSSSQFDSITTEHITKLGLRLATILACATGGARAILLPLCPNHDRAINDL